MSIRKRIIFVTGTDTGVGKTLFTALLLRHLRGRGARALAMKPFCSGGTGDVKLLQSLQPGELSEREMNPFYFTAPLAPLAAARRGQRVRLGDTREKIRAVSRKCDILLVEGSGGLLVPLGPGFAVADLIASLRCEVIVVARDGLGVINHTLLTVLALEQFGVARKALRVVLMGAAKPDISSRTNGSILRKSLNPVPVITIPFLGRKKFDANSVEEEAARLRRRLIRCVRRWK